MPGEKELAFVMLAADNNVELEKVKRVSGNAVIPVGRLDPNAQVHRYRVYAARNGIVCCLRPKYQILKTVAPRRSTQSLAAATAGRSPSQRRDVWAGCTNLSKCPSQQIKIPAYVLARLVDTSPSHEI